MARVLEHENLIAGYQSHVVTEEIIVAPEQELSLGQVFALNENHQAVAVSGALTADDVYGIMADAVATSVGESKKAVCYVAGEFNSNKIILPVDAEVASYKVALRGKGIYLRSAISADIQEEE
ncbi:hypothetical protein OXB_2984 [Bacillus sp. OxB-1]|uniref:hypothetical protein n=1 Tax=Bacillus sp. (strain OxB-1) TaxID=98228 RepID=UPI000581C02E|nr:hypothetical protein [Bacillus sp. OxB-1]BAQ11454.1 hypothetical protein OXB_2984 [Bacillus sp. OxB-1]